MKVANLRGHLFSMSNTLEIFTNAINPDTVMDDAIMSAGDKNSVKVQLERITAQMDALRKELFHVQV